MSKKRSRRKEGLGAEPGLQRRSRRKGASPSKSRREDDWEDKLDRRDRQRWKAAHKDEGLDDDEFDVDDELEEELDFDHPNRRDVYDDYPDDNDYGDGDYDFDD